jgi:hypothetical protein
MESATRIHADARAGWHDGGGGMMANKIYLWCVPSGWAPNDVIGYALAEDGTRLASHLSSHVGFSKYDMGLTSGWKHDFYKAHYPDGYELEWVDDPDNHPALLAALELNEKRYQEEQAKGEVA